jgi:5-methylcytosine-specific restriction endonuclease McrA
MVRRPRLQAIAAARGFSTVMPDALLRACTRCGRPTSSSPCANCRRARNQQRGSSSARGYGQQWRHFVLGVRRRMISLGIVPQCGARLPEARVTADSTCAANGRLVTAYLQLDHIDPLEPYERRDPRIVCDPTRVQFLCESCHKAKTRREQEQGKL